MSAGLNATSPLAEPDIPQVFWPILKASPPPDPSSTVYVFPVERCVVGEWANNALVGGFSIFGEWFYAVCDEASGLVFSTRLRNRITLHLWGGQRYAVVDTQH